MKIVLLAFLLKPALKISAGVPLLQRNILNKFQDKMRKKGVLHFYLTISLCETCISFQSSYYFVY